MLDGFYTENIHNNRLPVQIGYICEVPTKNFGISCIFLQYNFFCLDRFVGEGGGRRANQELCIACRTNMLTMVPIFVMSHLAVNSANLDVLTEQ